MKKLLQLLHENRARALAGGGVQTRIVQAKASDEATVYLYDVIVSDKLTAEYWGGVCAQDFVPQIAAIEASTIHLRINSPGGDVFAGQAIGAALDRHSAKVIGHVDGIAASAATGIACACDELLMADGAMYMIHNAWTFAMGDRNDLAKTIELLAKVDGDLARQYQERSSQDLKQISDWMDAETWFTAAEAIEAGFANGMDESKKAKASARAAAGFWNLAAYDHAPKTLVAPPADDPIVYLNEDHRARQQQRLQVAGRTRSL